MRRHGDPVAANGVDALAAEPVVCDGEMAGRVTSGRVRHNLNASIAPGCVPTWLSERTDGFQIESPGVLHGAAIVSEPPIDPTGAGMRS